MHGFQPLRCAYPYSAFFVFIKGMDDGIWKECIGVESGGKVHGFQVKATQPVISADIESFVMTV